MAPSKSKKSTGTPITDPRFAHIQSDPRFRLPSKKNQRVALDSRFKRLLQDDEFRSKASVDRYGRKVNKKERGKELERLYRVEDEEEKPTARKSKQPELASASEDEEESGEDDKVVRRELRRAEGYDPAREGGFSSSESESESEDEEELDVEELDGEELENVTEEVEEGEVTTRIAVVNLDWDNIRAVDLLAVARSFVPADGTVEKVTVYPSEFGRERMEQEEQDGPPREIFRQGKPTSSARVPLSKAKRSKKKAHNPEFSDSESESESQASDSEEEDERIKNQLLEEENPEDFNPAALREYQLSRLRYFYAVITLSSTSSAHSLYTSMDGREYLSSANFFDLRFVPDDTEFDESPRDEALEVPPGYRPNEFVTDALTRSKVRLTWDEDDRERKEVQRRAFARGEEEDADLAAYIGSSSSESEKEEGDQEGGVSVSRAADGKKDEKAAKLRAALGLTGALPQSKKNGQSGEMTMTWTTGEASAAGPEPSKNESTREAYVRKEKERKAKRKEKAKARRAAETGEAQDSGSEGGVPIIASNAAEADDMEEADPFDDPFFTQDPETAKQEAKKAAKAQKARKRAEQTKAEEAAKVERAQLELLLDDEEERGKHFDMAAIEKAQKQAKRKGKKKKSAAQDAEATADGFKIDVEDPRFQKLYTNHEFAIDPSNPRYKATDGMKALLEEGRRKRKNRGAERDVEEDAPGKKKKRKDGKADDLAALVAKVKAKEKRK